MSATASSDHEMPGMDRHEADVLLEDHFAGELAEHDLERLVSFLKSSPDAREHAAGLLAQHELLGEFYRQRKSEDAEEFVRATTRRIEKRLHKQGASKIIERTMGAVRRLERSTGPRRPGRPARDRWLARFAVAAAILTGVGIWWFGGERVAPRGGALIARVEQASGWSVLILEDEKTPLEAGDELRAGAEIETGPDGVVRLAWANEPTRIELEAASRLGMRGPKLSYLQRGRLTATVAKQDPSDAFVVETPHALATVVGTRFSLSVSQSARDTTGNDGASLRTDAPSSDSTRLVVSEGAVRMTRLLDGATREVAAGGSAVAGAVGEAVRAIASFEFETPTDPDHFNGQPVARPEGGTAGNRYCMKSAFGRHDGPVEVISWHDWEKPLFLYSKAGEMAFDYYLAAPTQWACVTIYDSDKKLAFSALFDSRTAGRWLHARPSLSDFTTTGHPGEVSPPRGMAVHAVMIQCPAGDGRGLYVDNLSVLSTDASWTPSASGVDQEDRSHRP